MRASVGTIGITADDVASAEQIERSLLACCLRADEIGGGGLDDVAAVVRPEDFATYAHQLVFRAMLELRAAKVTVTAATAYQQLRKGGHLADLGERPADWLAELLDLEPTGALAGFYAGEVRDAAQKRALKRAHLEMSSVLYEPGLSATEAAARCERIVFEASSATAPTSGPRSLADLVREELVNLDDRASNGAPIGVQTGFTEIDRLVGGMRPGQMVVLGARPAVGKTALSLGIASNVAAAGVPVLFVSLEMPSEELTQRLLSLRSGVPLTAIREGRLTAAQVDKLYSATPAVRELPLRFEDTPNMTADRLAATARREVRRNGAGLLVVDYLQLVTPENPRENRNAQIGLLARRLKLLARECGIPVLVLSQLNRETENRPNPKPRLSDLRDSGEVEQHADIVLLLSEQRGPNDDERFQIVDCDIAKNRNGPTGEVTLRRVRALTRFENAPM